MYARNQAYNIWTESHELKLPQWNAEGFRVGFASDFHLNGESQLERSIEAVNWLTQQGPDVIVLGGDFMEKRYDPLFGLLDRFLDACASASCPVFGVMGNHDYWSRASRMIIERFERTPVKLLLNEVAEVQGVTIAGVDDAVEKQARYDFFPKERVSKSLIAVLHEPDPFDKQPEHVSVQLSGHSHGGQVCLPFGKAIYTPGMARKYVSGTYQRDESLLYVSRGVGTTGPDYRLFCPPEATILTLRSA